MAKKRKKVVKKTEPAVEKEYYEEVEIIDSKTGKKKKIKVKIIRYESRQGSSDIDESKDEMIDSINSKVSIKPIIDEDR